MASGLPVVATPNIGARYVTDEGRAGILAPLERLGLALRDLLLDGPDRRDLEAASLLRSREFSLAGVADEYDALYRGKLHGIAGIHR
jgi:glycosyltransferase involved in cell wall biosynthesis